MMSQNRIALQTFGRLALMASAFLALTACPDAKSAAESRVYQMGERVDVGGVVYTVLESEWRANLGEGPDEVIPKNRFLVLRVTITNGTGTQANLPFLTVESVKQEASMEIDNAKALPGWMGLIRIVQPAQTEEGKLVFDVAPGAYKLRVSSGSGDSEVTRLVEVPYNPTDLPIKAQ